MADPVPQAAAPPAPRPGLLARLFPPMPPDQADILSRIRLPCC
jgi:hypothetical protein